MATLKDIATAAGVSVDTVSRVLNGKAGEAWPSAVERAERIREIARSLNYSPNRAARIMRTRRTQQIGVLVSELYNPFTGRKVEAIADALARHGYEMLLGLTRGNVSDPLVFLEHFSDNLLDGVINLDPFLGAEDFRRILPKIPCLTFNRSQEDSPAVFDMETAVVLLMEHLWELGHRRIALVTGTDKGDMMQSRLAAYNGFYAGRPVALRRNWVIPANWTEQEGRKAAAELAKTDCTACVAGNDLLAVGLIAGLRELKKSVPGDFSICSIEDSLLTEIAYPTLTSVRQPVDALVELTVSALIAQINGKEPPAFQRLAPTLITRASSAAVC